MSVKPAMAVGHAPRAALQSPPVPGGSLPGAMPRGPQVPAAIDRRKLASKVDVRLTGPLRGALTEAAKAAGVTDGAYVRRLVADALGLDAEADRGSGPRQRIPDADLMVLAGLVREVGSLYGPARAGKTEEVILGLDGIRGALVPMVVGLNARASA
ncbi:hypothetical protein [Methylobacterium sp. CM6244]